MAVAPTRTPSTILELGRAGTCAGLCLSHAPRSSPAGGPIPANEIDRENWANPAAFGGLGPPPMMSICSTQIATAQASRPLRSLTRSSHVEPVARPCRHLLLPRAASRYSIALSRVPSVRSGTSSLPVTLSGRRIRSCFDASWRNGKGGRRSPDEHDLLEHMPVQMTAELYMTRSAPAT